MTCDNTELWALFALNFAAIVAWRWSRAMAYREGVWDGTHNPHIPPVQRALEQLHKRGWQP